MKIYPDNIDWQEVMPNGLTRIKDTTRKVALVVAFLSVYFFFIKLIFL